MNPQTFKRGTIWHHDFGTEIYISVSPGNALRIKKDGLWSPPNIEFWYIGSAPATILSLKEALRRLDIRSTPAWGKDYPELGPYFPKVLSKVSLP